MDFFRCKRMKTELNLMDVLVDELPMLVMSYLNGSDLLALSEVSRLFNQLVAQHTHGKGKHKIRLVIKETSSKHFDADLIVNSNRRYASMRITRLWKDRGQIIRLLSDPSNKFEEIQTCYDIDMNGLSMPGLRSLDIAAPKYFENGLLSSTSNLTQLCLESFEKVICSPKQILESLFANSQLEHLTLDGNSAKVFFSFELEEALFSLKSFKCNSANFYGLTEYNFLSFLSLHATSLHTIKLLHCPFRLLCRAINKLPNLQRLTYSPPIDLSFQPYPINPLSNITEMNLVFASPAMSAHLINSTPKLQKLYTAELKLDVFRYATFKLHELQSLRYAYLEPNLTVECLEKFYECNKENLRGFNRNISFSQI